MIAGLVSGLLGPVLEKIIPDKNARAAAQEKLSHMEVSGELEQVKSQIAVNLQEAKHESLWVAGWRPFIGWVCGVSLVYNYMLEPFAQYAFPGLPTINDTAMVTILLGMLGLGGARSFEKFKGANKQR